MIPNPSIFGIEIAWFPFFHWLGVAMGYIIGIWYYKTHNKSVNGTYKMVFFLLLLMPVALLGSRVPGIIERYVDTGIWPPLSVFLWSPTKGLFRWCGTLLIFLLLLPPLAKWMKIKNFASVFDSLAIALCPLTAIVKQGCLFSGDGCYGIPTTLPWGMHFLHGPAPSFLPVHPTPLYDGIFHFSLFAFLIFWDKRKAFAGQTALFYFAASSVFYILLEVIRINPHTGIGLTVPQITYFLILFVAVFYYYRRRKRSRGIGERMVGI